MVEDQVKLIKVISHGIVPRFIDIAADEFLTTSVKLRDAATAYRNKHFEDRGFFKCFTATMVKIKFKSVLDVFRLLLPTTWTFALNQQTDLKSTFV